MGRVIEIDHAPRNSESQRQTDQRKGFDDSSGRIKMKYLRVKNWDKYQGHKYRRPAWIKFHARLLKDAEFCAMSDGAKLTAHQLWLLVAAEGDDGRIEAWKATRESLQMKTKPKVDELVAHGFVVIEDVNAPVNAFDSNPANKPAVISTLITLNSDSLDSPEGESEGKPSPLPEMSDGQYVFLASQVSQWQKDNGDLFIGGDGESFERAFFAKFFMPYKVFIALRDRFASRYQESA